MKKKKKRIKIKITYLLKDFWISLGHEQRAFIKQWLGIKPDESPETASGRIISDGVSQGVLNEFFTPKKVAGYLGTKKGKKKWAYLWADFLEAVDEGIIKKKELHELDELRKRKDERRMDTEARVNRLKELEEKYPDKKIEKQEKEEDDPEEKDEKPKKKVVKKKKRKEKK